MVAAMGCSIRFHDRIGRERLTAACEPVTVDAALALLEAAIAETTRVGIASEACEIELSLVGDAEMTRLNFDHMGERGPTDVLSFPLHTWNIEEGTSRLADDDFTPPGPLLLGDVVLDVDQAVRQAAGGEWSVLEELVLLAIHGTLHLMGHDHADLEEEQAMRALERQVLTTLHRTHREVDWRPGSLFDRDGHAVHSGV
jgi:probable rRNA maturation factor